MRREPANDNSESEDEGKEIEPESESASSADQPMNSITTDRHTQYLRTLLPHWHSEINLSSPALLDLLSETPLSSPPSTAQQTEQRPPSDDEFEDF